MNLKSKAMTIKASLLKKITKIQTAYDNVNKKIKIIGIIITYVFFYWTFLKTMPIIMEILKELSETL